jgi:hypothetical protein
MIHAVAASNTRPIALPTRGVSPGRSASIISCPSDAHSATAEAERRATEALRIGRRIGVGKPEHALELAGAANAVREQWGIPITQAELAMLERSLASAKMALEAEARTRAYSRGLAMDLEQAIIAARD